MTASRPVPTVWTLGINHESAPVDVRARFAFSGAQLSDVLHDLARQFQAPELGQTGSAPIAQAPATPEVEIAILSTCNRTEIYGTGGAQEAQRALHWLAQQSGLQIEELAHICYQYFQEDAVRHAFRVACGLDSMVLGEPQILGQMKDAARRAQQAGTLGTSLHQLFQRSFAVAKSVRSETDIGAHSISMAAAAVRLASQLFEDLSRIRILFVGAGEMIELAMTHFAAKHPAHISVCNRSPEPAHKLCQQFHAQYIPLTQLPERLAEFDAIVSCTASTLPIIGLGAIESALKARRHRPIFMVDLAVPRDVEAQVGELDDVYLYTLDDLSHVVETGQAQRQAAVQEAQTYIEAGLQDYALWLDQRRSTPLIQSLQERSQQWQAQEIARVKKRLSQGEDLDQALASLAAAVSQKWLHGPMNALRASDKAQRALAEQAISHWYLQEPPANPKDSDYTAPTGPA